MEVALGYFKVPLGNDGYPNNEKWTMILPEDGGFELKDGELQLKPEELKEKLRELTCRFFGSVIIYGHCKKEGYKNELELHHQDEESAKLQLGRARAEGEQESQEGTAEEDSELEGKYSSQKVIGPPKTATNTTEGPAFEVAQDPQAEPEDTSTPSALPTPPQGKTPERSSEGTGPKEAVSEALKDTVSYNPGTQPQGPSGPEGLTPDSETDSGAPDTKLGPGKKDMEGPSTGGGSSAILPANDPVPPANSTTDSSGFVKTIFGGTVGGLTGLLLDLVYGGDMLYYRHYSNH
ncbi:hypothetical protein BEWA_023580 [Theileria equi strain WA]|uniref:Uncharacterized protein n=1 Tax=Theileria equi strain WA TaxID=1537102 RepID=L0AX92_THEEQ|nr:hypothetical protein BEWA_023580 [Theileria equi strain WA]AFZ79509.1 hypothetical protein BEWA_023580 [Theileria equi strain WA]|eukprot:XP_004829175.1 hypothetical protein BEWA_023580 [Theileria equi strain WA]